MAKVSASKKEHVLKVLLGKGEKGITAQALIKQCGERSPARVYDLRNDGYSITTKPSRGPECRYTLHGKRPKKKGKKDGKSRERA